MKKIYQQPISTIETLELLKPYFGIESLTGDTGDGDPIGDGGGDTGGQNDPDAKHRGDVWGNLW